MSTVTPVQPTDDADEYGYAEGDTTVRLHPACAVAVMTMLVAAGAVVLHALGL